MKVRGCIFAVRDFLLGFNCSPVQGRVLKGLAEFADSDGSNIFPGDRLLARATYLATRKLKPAIQYWLDRKILVLVESGRPRHSAVYRIDLSQLDSAEESSTSRDSIPQGNQVGVSDSIPFESNSIPRHTSTRFRLRNHTGHTGTKETGTKKETLTSLAPRRNLVIEEFNEEVYLTLLEFEKFRKQIRKPLTEHALELVLKKLGELRAQGQDPVKVIEQSIMNGWTGIFELKDGGKYGRPTESFAERNIRRADEELGEVSRRAQQTLQKVGKSLPKPTDRPGDGTRLLGSPSGSKP